VTGGADTTLTARGEALAAAQRWRLPFGRQSWRGAAGNWQGSGLGSSIDFQDHRAYVAGDDPRYLHWAAYARTGQLTMKLYRAEVSPLVDVAVDVSASMTYDPVKAARGEALLQFCVESATRAGAPVRVHAVDGRRVRAVATEAVRAGDWRDRLGGLQAAGAAEGATAREGAVPTVDAMPSGLPWRTGTMKVLITDLLFPGDPGALLRPMTAAGGLAMVLVVTRATEAEVPGTGNWELVDCEGGAGRRQRIDAALAERYRGAYERHFKLWREAARRCNAGLGRVPGEGALTAALGGEARAQGVVEASAR
jgi:uncharacterized protein (DUF58 family)